jgi:hypothetical protein
METGIRFCVVHLGNLEPEQTRFEVGPLAVVRCNRSEPAIPENEYVSVV